LLWWNPKVELGGDRVGLRVVGVVHLELLGDDWDDAVDLGGSRGMEKRQSENELVKKLTFLITYCSQLKYLSFYSKSNGLKFRERSERDKIKERQKDKNTKRQRGKKTKRPKEKETKRQKDRKTKRQKGRKRH
jgi:hypothetical protein